MVNSWRALRYTFLRYLSSTLYISKVFEFGAIHFQGICFNSPAKRQIIAVNHDMFEKFEFQFCCHILNITSAIDISETKQKIPAYLCLKRL